MVVVIFSGYPVFPPLPVRCKLMRSRQPAFSSPLSPPANALGCDKQTSCGERSAYQPSVSTSVLFWRHASGLDPIFIDVFTWRAGKPNMVWRSPVSVVLMLMVCTPPLRSSSGGSAFADFG